MKRIGLATLFFLSFTKASFAFGGTAFLVRCNIETTKWGNMVYVGKYNYNGQHISYVFDSWCPSQIQIDEY